MQSRETLRRGDTQNADGLMLMRDGGALRRLGLAHHTLTVPMARSAGLRKRQLPRRPVQQARAEAFFQPAHLLADRRLRQAKAQRGRGETPCLHHSRENAEIIEPKHTTLFATTNNKSTLCQLISHTGKMYFTPQRRPPMQNHFIAAGSGQVQNVLGMRHVNKLTPENGQLVLELTIPPGLGAPPHMHEGDAESFYVLSGEITFVTDGATCIARAGDFQHLPVGGVHAFRNDGTVEAHALVIATPGIEALRFFTSVDALMSDGRADPATVAATAKQSGLHILA